VAIKNSENDVSQKRDTCVSKMKRLTHFTEYQFIFDNLFLIIEKINLNNDEK